MTMNFFKRVMTFFSTIWNAILWRKTDKKTKQVAKVPKDEDLEERGDAKNDSTSFSETEKLFVDVPLDPPEEISETELTIRDEIPETLRSHHTESQPVADIGIKKYPSGVQLFGFEDETTKILSFFSEPVRDHADSVTPLLSAKDEKRELCIDINAVSDNVPIGEDTDVSKEKADDDVVGSQASEESPSPPSDLDFIYDDSQDQNCFSELFISASEVPSPPNTFLSCEDVEVIIPNNEVLLETQPSLENLSSLSANRIPLFRKSSINPDLRYFSMCDEIHLFDHDGVSETALEGCEVCKDTDTVQENETPEIVESGSISMQKSSEMLETAAAVFKDVQIYETASTLGSQVVPINVSVSSTQSTSDAYEQSPGSTSEYSTNFVVKSDSLVNFLPEGGSDIDAIADITEELLRMSKNSINHEEGGEIFPISSTLLKEGELEEIMCTPRGILKLSGDHYFECPDENHGTIDDPNRSHVKTAVDDFLLDAFVFDEPLLSTHHLEHLGCVLEETSIKSDTEDSPLFREIFKNAGLQDTESVQDLDGTKNDEYEFDSEPDNIVRCRSIIHDSPKMPIVTSRSRKDLQNENPKPGQNERVEDTKSPRRLREFTTFQLDDESGHLAGHLKRNDLLASVMPTARYGEQPSKSLPLDIVGLERDTASSYLDHKDESDSTKTSMVDSQNSNELHIGPGWRVTSPSLTEFAGVSETHIHESDSSIPFTHVSPMMGTGEKSCNNFTVEKIPQTQPDEDMDDFYPFIDCSSYLFRIPEEIRKETNFNPCVGATPARRSYTNNANFDSMHYNNDECNGFENKYPNMNSFVRHSAVGAVPMVNSCIPEEYKSTRVAKLPDGYNQRPVPQNVDHFWGAHSGIPHPGNQSETIVGYPVRCDGNYYEGEDLNVPAAYENDRPDTCNNSESYGYMNPFGAVEFPLLGIPLCTPQSQSGFMPRVPLSPIIFPIGPMNVPQNENLPSLVNMETPPPNEQFTIPHTWRGYSVNLHDEEEKEIISMVEVQGLAPILENLSCTGTNDEGDDFDDNPIPDPYFQSLADNNSLHTVKSKADSYSGSLFCESFRSLISHNTENENTFPSFSCSSVQGCCPSVVLQSCETTLSNDSLPSITVEETNYSKGEDEDYLATEKFMNDVNTALNESVLDQIQGRLDLHSSLLGRGDGSLPVVPDEHEDNMETSENDVMLRNSLGENISINNSKLTLLDGILGTDNGGSHLDPPQNLWEIDSESSRSASNYCRGVLNSLVENVITSLVDQPVEFQEDITDAVTDCRGNLDESLLQESPERDLIVQNMMFIEGVPDQVKQIWTECLMNKTEWHDQREEDLLLDGAVEVYNASGASDDPVEEASKNSANNIIDKPLTVAADDIPSRKGRKNRKRRKKLSNIDSEVEPEICSEVTDIGDGITTLKDQHMKSIGEKFEEEPACTLIPEQSKAETSKPKGDGEQLANENTKDSPKSEQDVAPIADEGDGHQEEDDEPGGNALNNRRRRNRRRKRKN